jgi:hypothetical protein
MNRILNFTLLTRWFVYYCDVIGELMFLILLLFFYYPVCAAVQTTTEMFVQQCRNGVSNNNRYISTRDTAAVSTFEGVFLSIFSRSYLTGSNCQIIFLFLLSPSGAVYVNNIFYLFFLVFVLRHRLDNR